MTTTKHPADGNLTAPADPVLKQQLAAAQAWGLFVDWCVVTGREALPLKTGTVVAFLADCPAAPGTWSKRVRAIASAARAAGFPPLERTRELQDLLRGRPARPARLEVTVEQLHATLVVLPSHGWTAGWFGRRDRALLVLAHQVGLPYRHIARLTAGDLSFTTGGPVTVATPAGPVLVQSDPDPVLCGACCLARWVQALNLAVTFQPVAGHVDHAPAVTNRSAHACLEPVVLGETTRASVLLPPTDQWGSTDINPDPLRPQSLSTLARLHGAGHHPVHRNRLRPARGQATPPTPEPAPTATGLTFGQGAWRAGWERRNADRERLANLDTVLDDLDRRAKELEGRTAELLKHS